MADILNQLATTDASEIQGVAPPSEKVVDWLHGKASTSRPEDIHHRIGFGPADSASGAHTHNGKDSKYIIPAGTTLTDLATTATLTQTILAVNQINAVLRMLGAE